MQQAVQASNSSLQAMASAISGMLGDAERANDASIAEGGMMLATMVREFAGVGLANTLEQKAVETLLTAIDRSVQSRRSYRELHAHLADKAVTLGVDTTAFGDCTNYPSRFFTSGAATEAPVSLRSVG